MKRLVFMLVTVLLLGTGCADENNNNPNTNNSISGVGSYNDIKQYMPEGFPVLDLPNDINYTQTTTVDGRYLELVTKLQKSYINNLLNTLSTYYNIQFDINNNQWQVENSEHSLNMSYNETLEELIFNFTFKPSTDSLKVKDYIVIESSGTMTSDPAYSLIMLSTNGKVYVKGYNLDGEVGNGSICSNDYDCMAHYISSINETTGINEKVTKIFKTNINDSLFAVTETGKLYSWGNDNPTPRTLITISGQIKDIMEFNDNINYLYTNTNKLYELKYIDNSWSVKEIVISDEKIMQVYLRNIIYLLTESGKQYSYDYNTSDIKQISGIDEKIKYVFHQPYYGYDDLHIVITENNKIYGWGQDYYEYILDEYKYGMDVNIPKLLDWDISTNGMITQFLGNGFYAVTDKGLLYRIGYNAGIVPDINNITKVDIQVDIRYNHYMTTFLTTSDGSVYTLLGDEITKIDGLKNIKKFYTTYHASYKTNIYAITENGDVYSTGSNYVGILGLGNPDKSYTTNVAEKVNIPEPVKEIYTHINDETYAIYAVTNNGNVYAWGNNEGRFSKAAIGILGIGNTTNEYIPAPTKVNISNVTKITNIINDDFDRMSTAYALTKDNKLYHWGYSKNTPGGWYPDLIITPQLIDRFFKTIR